MNTPRPTSQSGGAFRVWARYFGESGGADPSWIGRPGGRAGPSALADQPQQREFAVDPGQQFPLPIERKEGVLEPGTRDRGEL